jgi:hydroxymethylglutaryl-CoA lyase
MIRLTECPRDAIQGIHDFIPTSEKVEYIKLLSKVGFDMLDMGSFVSPKAVPQLKDTQEVLNQLTPEDKHNTEYLVIVANERGAIDASTSTLVDILGFPFSISENFQIRNTKSTREESLERVKAISDIASEQNKKLRIYLSMAFGNPYNEEWSEEIVLGWAHQLKAMGIKEFALSDTTGLAGEKEVSGLFNRFQEDFPNTLISAHFHAAPEKQSEKLLAAYNSGCRAFDSAIAGMGGCPFAEDELVGNINTASLLEILPKSELKNIHLEALSEAITYGNRLYSKYS